MAARPHHARQAAPRPGVGLPRVHLAWCALLLWLLCPTVHATEPKQGTELKIATWNLNWLTVRPPAAAHLPHDVVPRGAEDLDRLAAYATQLDADVVALQEVDGWDAAARLFPRDRWAIHMTRDRLTQRVGIVVRRGIRFEANPDVTAIAVDASLRLRSGADVTLHLPGHDLRILAVHLKRGCQDQPLARSTRPACVELRAQLAPLQGWIADRQREGTAYVLLGDFNRWMDGRDRFLSELTTAAPLRRATAGRSSPCWGNEAFIDHILLGGAARDWLVPDSLRVLTYREQGPNWRDRLSDHCPVSVRLDVTG